MAVTNNEFIRNHAAFIWSEADLLRVDYKQSEYGRVVLPLTVLRRLDVTSQTCPNGLRAPTSDREGADARR